MRHSIPSPFYRYGLTLVSACTYCRVVGSLALCLPAFNEGFGTTILSRKGGLTQTHYL